MLKENKSENIDLSGGNWNLAPEGKSAIYKCQSRIWEIHVELSGYGALFRNLNNSEFTTQELYGVSLLLERMSRRLSKISDMLAKTTAEEKKK